MSAQPLAEALSYVGAIGVLQFVSLAFSARQLQGVTNTRLRRRILSPAARHAHLFALLSAGLLLAGITLRMS